MSFLVYLWTGDAADEIGLRLYLLSLLRILRRLIMSLEETLRVESNSGLQVAPRNIFLHVPILLASLSYILYLFLNTLSHTAIKTTRSAMLGLCSDQPEDRLRIHSRIHLSHIFTTKVEAA